jgi:hypothetical protein
MSDKDSFPTIISNEVKKDAEVTLKDGTKCIVIDNKRGNIRMLKVPRYQSPGEFDYGDDYVFKWEFVEQGGIIYRVVLTPAQVNQEEVIKQFDSMF